MSEHQILCGSCKSRRNASLTPNLTTRWFVPGVVVKTASILDPADVDTWLHGSYDEVVALQRPYDASRMTVRGPVFPTRRNET